MPSSSPVLKHLPFPPPPPLSLHIEFNSFHPFLVPYTIEIFSILIIGKLKVFWLNQIFWFESFKNVTSGYIKYFIFFSLKISTLIKLLGDPAFTLIWISLLPTPEALSWVPEKSFFSFLTLQMKLNNIYKSQIIVAHNIYYFLLSVLLST